MGQIDLAHEKWAGTPMPQGYPPVLVPNGVSQCRLSLTSGTPVTTADVTGASALLLEAYTGNRILLPTDWGEWRAFALPRTPAGLYEVSQSFLASSPWALTAATVYDVFAFLDRNGAVNIALGPAWTGNTVRGTAATLALRDGARVLGTIPSWLYVGTIYASGTNTVDDSGTKRFVWNAYNRVPRQMYKTDATANHTYTIDTWRQFDAAAANQLDMVLGLSVEPIFIESYSLVFNASSIVAACGIGISSTTTNSATIWGTAGGASDYWDSYAKYIGWPGIGRFFLVWLQRSDAAGTTTWFATDATTRFGSGIYGEVTA